MLSQGKTLPALLAVLAALLALPAGATAAASPRPQLLLIHGGAFLVDDAGFEPLTRERALAAGFEPHYLSYPLGDMRAAVREARDAARRLRARFGAGNVYAYGTSAGGTLATLLSGDGLVRAAVAKAPVTDLVHWRWPLTRYGSGYFGDIGLGLRARYRLSPLTRPQRRPLLVVQGWDDNVVPPAMSSRFAEKFQRVHLWMVPGGHTTERYRPYLITRAMQWLGRIAARDGERTGGFRPRPQPCSASTSSGTASEEAAQAGACASSTDR